MSKPIYYPNKRSNYVIRFVAYLFLFIGVVAEPLNGAFAVAGFIILFENLFSEMKKMQSAQVTNNDTLREE